MHNIFWFVALNGYLCLAATHLTHYYYPIRTGNPIGTTHVQKATTSARSILRLLRVRVSVKILTIISISNVDKKKKLRIRTPRSLLRMYKIVTVQIGST